MTKNCPTCKEPALQDVSNDHRPFCSERCQWIDLGAWLTESYNIPGEPSNDGTGGPSDRPTPEPYEQ